MEQTAANIHDGLNTRLTCSGDPSITAEGLWAVLGREVPTNETQANVSQLSR